MFVKFDNVYVKHSRVCLESQAEPGGAVYTGGMVQRTAVLSAEVDKNEKSSGCHLADITLSGWRATGTLGSAHVRSPVGNITTISLW